VTGGGTQFDSTVGPEPNITIKAAVAFQASSTILCVNGTLGTVDTAVTLPTVNRLLVGARGDNATTGEANGHLRSIAYFNNRLSDAQLQVLTAPPLITSLSLDFINGVYEG
jgi:hypothetical protein